MNDQEKIATLRTALLRLVGAETAEDLVEIEAGLRIMRPAMSAEDFDATMGAVEALRNTAEA